MREFSSEGKKEQERRTEGEEREASRGLTFDRSCSRTLTGVDETEYSTDW